MGKPEGKRPIGSPRRTWEDNIKKGLQVVECGVVDFIYLVQERDRLQACVNAAMNLRVL